jgi:hypothetical protein
MAPPQYGSSRSYPPAPLSDYSFRHPRPHNQPPRRSVERVERVPEDKIPSGEEQHAVINKSESPYDEACTYVEGFKKAVGSLDSYEKPLSIKISRHDWIKLSHDLEIFDTDQKYRISFYDP